MKGKANELQSDHSKSKNPTANRVRTSLNTKQKNAANKNQTNNQGTEITEQKVEQTLPRISEIFATGAVAARTQNDNTVEDVNPRITNVLNHESARQSSNLNAFFGSQSNTSNKRKAGDKGQNQNTLNPPAKRQAMSNFDGQKVSFEDALASIGYTSDEFNTLDSELQSDILIGLGIECEWQEDEPEEETERMPTADREEKAKCAENKKDDDSKRQDYGGIMISKNELRKMDIDPEFLKDLP